MRIEQFRYGRDNLAYLLYGARQALAIDGGAAERMNEFVKERDLQLTAIVNTHSHGDHTSGNGPLHELSGAPVLAVETVRKMKRIELDNEVVEVLETPGHTLDSVCFRAAELLVTGDTLFNGTVGNCFSGEMGLFFSSVKKLMRLPPETKIYAGHDYVRDSFAFAARLEPDNAAIPRFLARYNAGLVVSTLADEFAINPFLRFNERTIVELLAARKMKRGTEFERWESLMWIE